MAAVALTKNELLCMTPFLIRRITITGGTTGAAITHGELMSPSFVLPVVKGTFTSNDSDATVSEVFVNRTTSATTMAVDCLVDAANVIELYCFWIPQARTDGQSINQDNNT